MDVDGFTGPWRESDIRKKIWFVTHIKAITVKIEIIVNHFSLIFETTSKFLIAFVRLILGRKGVDRCTRPQQKIYVRN